MMHPLHYAVEANNIKAVEKLKVASSGSERIDFFARDGTHLELAQEYAAPTAPIYKILQKIQFMQQERSFITHKADMASSTRPFGQQRIMQQSPEHRSKPVRLSDLVPKPKQQFTAMTHTYTSRRHFARVGPAQRSTISGSDYRRLIVHNNNGSSAS